MTNLTPLRGGAGGRTDRGNKDFDAESNLHFTTTSLTATPRPETHKALIRALVANPNELLYPAHKAHAQYFENLMIDVELTSGVKFERKYREAKEKVGFRLDAPWCLAAAAVSLEVSS